ncbi:MAG: DUF2723 domain-containing protein, partial [Gemmatimonadaceae bacterium]
MLLVVYLVTLAPGVTFWDAGEFIAAAHVFGIPHPPGTPLFVALGRAWTLLFGSVLGVARAMNLLSAVSTAVAAAVLVAVAGRAPHARMGALAGALCAGLMLTAWSNATETEVYAISLLHVMLMLLCGARASGDGARAGRWVWCLAYLIALAPAMHLSALVGAPAAIALASRDLDLRWRIERAALLLGVLVMAAGVGRMSALVVAIGAMLCVASAWLTTDRAGVRAVLPPLGFVALGASALLIMLVRARFDPAINQGNPATITAMMDVVARRQYDVAPLWPRRAPVWLQLATLTQYVDWQFAWTWGRGIFSTPLRGLVTFAFVCLGGVGWGALRRDDRRTSDALTLLLACGSVGVVAYLNLRAGASIGYGFVPADAHEARERDYFFVLAFWAWGFFAGYGAVHALTARRWPHAFALLLPCVPLVANWTAADRARGDGATAPREVASALLASAPPNAVLFLAGDNDSYPLWYLQQVEGVRTDVTTVTFPLLPAEWYEAELARRTRLHWPSSGVVPGAKWQHEELAARIAESARVAGRPVAVSPSLPAAERALLG